LFCYRRIHSCSRDIFRYTYLVIGALSLFIIFSHECTTVYFLFINVWTPTVGSYFLAHGVEIYVKKTIVGRG
jgi:hypothetical protein